MFFADPTLDAVTRGAVLAALFMAWIVVLTRVVGLRSFSKMAAVDFVATIATGSLLATAATSSTWTAFLQAVTAVTALFIVQVAFAWMRQRLDRFKELVDNTPKVLMRDGVIDRDALRQTRVAHDDVIAKLREANALHRDDVRFVVLETTGDISVLHGDDEIDSELVDGLR